MIKIKIADATGHTELMVDNREAEALINKHKESWVFVDGRLINPAEINYEQIEEIELMPPLVGGTRTQNQLNNDLRMKHLDLDERRLLSTLRNKK